MTVMCHRCGKEFPAQWRLERHLNRKKPCIKPSQKTTKTYQKNTKLSQKTTKTSQNIRYSCKYCNRSYKHNWHLTRHLKTCKDRISIMEFKKKKEEEETSEIGKIKKELEKEKNYKLNELDELRKKVSEMEDLIKNQKPQTQNIYNTTNNNIININLNEYGSENVNFLKNPEYKKAFAKILGSGINGLQKYIQYKYCNPEAPENLTIKYTNKRQKDIYVRADNTWKVRNKHEVMDELYDKDKNVEEVLQVYEHLNDLNENDEIDQNQEKFMNDINDFYDNEDNDEYVKKELCKLKDETLNQLYNCYKENKGQFKKV